MPASLKARGVKPSVPAVPGPSSSGPWTLSASFDGQTMDSSLAGIRIGYADTTPSVKSDLTSVAESNTLINIADMLQFTNSDTGWKASLTATIPSVSAASGHHLYVLLFDSTAGADAPAIAVSDLGAIP